VGDLLNDIKSQSARHGNKSRLLTVLETMTKDDRKDLLAALDDHSIPASNICRALKKRGHVIDPSTISRYRRGELATDLHESL
jgi:hypothetical protein